ncbi:MAG: hypothetical protein E7055_16730 [Lentisphaerae bacterium]|nr:hypothetical protein [Lentisphaerota bacterium]
MISHLKVNLAQSAGLIRRLNGGNLGPNINHDNPEMEKRFRELEVPITRLHDAPLANPGMRLVDIHHIFGSRYADEQDEHNYYFDQTDHYLDTIRRCGSDIMYRLGCSIEFSRPRYNAKPPEDMEKWSNICLNIVRHYNDGWANGHHWNIRYWEVWNEPDDSGDNNGSYMWQGNCEQFCRLYETTAKKLKKAFPELKIGAASFWKLHNNAEDPARHTFMREFLEYCREKRLPLDFFSWHRYSSPELPFDLIDEPAEARKMLDGLGFTNTELHNTEWHYMHQWGTPYYVNGEHAPGSITAAAHYTSVLTAWQDTPLDMGYFYTIGGNGAFSPFYLARVLPLYYGMKAFTEITRYPERRQAGSDLENLRILAGVGSGNSFGVLISSFRTESEKALLKFEGPQPGACQFFRVDRERKLEEFAVERSGDTFTLPLIPGDSCIYLMKGTF